MIKEHREYTKDQGSGRTKGELRTRLRIFKEYKSWNPKVQRSLQSKKIYRFNDNLLK